MSGRFSSRRFRRRALWSGVGVLVVVGAVAGAIAIGNTGKSYDTPINANGKAWTFKPPPTTRLAAHDLEVVDLVASRFIQTAVVRKHLGRAWELLAPEMRRGQTRQEFVSGNNNVVPFDAVGIAAWHTAYMYPNDVGFDIALIGSRTNTFAGKTFTIELKRYPQHPKRWLVASWVPRGVGGVGQVKSLAAAPEQQLKPAVSAKWLAVPGVFFGGVLLAFAIWALLSTVRQRRTARHYAELLGQTTRPRGW